MPIPKKTYEYIPINWDIVRTVPVKTPPLTDKHLTDIFETIIMGVSTPPSLMKCGMASEADMTKQSKSAFDESSWTGICIGGPLDEELVQQPGKTFYVTTQMKNSQEKNIIGNLEERWMVYHGAYLGMEVSVLPEKYNTEDLPVIYNGGSTSYRIWQWKGWKKIGYREKDEDLFDQEVIMQGKSP